MCDDNRDFIEMIEFILKGNGYEVKTVLSGRGALSELEEFSPDLLLLDLFLPDMSGYEVLAEMSKREVSSPRVVVFSAMGGVEEKEKALSAGAVFYLAKPFNVPDLEDVVAAALSAG